MCSVAFSERIKEMKKKIFAFFAIALAVACLVFPSFAEGNETMTSVESTIEAEPATETETSLADELGGMMEGATPDQVEYIKSQIESVMAGMAGYDITGWDKIAAWVNRHIYAISWAVLGIGVALYAFVYIKKNRALSNHLATLNNNSIEIARASHEDSLRAQESISQYRDKIELMAQEVAAQGQALARTLSENAEAREKSSAETAEVKRQRQAETEAIMLLADAVAAIIQCSKINDARKDEIASKYTAARAKVGEVMVDESKKNR